jgi:uncharacterized protein (DUF111 family)
MDSEKYSRSIKLLCSTCGASDFEFDDESGPLQCTSCDRVFDREELIRENGGLIETEVDDLKAQVAGDVTRQLSDRFRKAFSGSKHIKFK